MRPQFVGAATRGECRLVATSKAKASPRGRASHKNSARAFICGSRDPRRMQTRSHLKSKSFGPRSGLPQTVHAPSFVGAATRGECRLVATSKAKASPRGRASHENSARALIFCGSRDPRRMQTRSHLKSKSFAPRSGLLHGVQPRASRFCGRHLKADECPPTVGQIDKRSARYDCLARWPSGSRPSPMLHPNSSSALPARRASRSNAEPRSDNAPG